MASGQDDCAALCHFDRTAASPDSARVTTVFRLAFGTPYSTSSRRSTAAVSCFLCRVEFDYRKSRCSWCFDPPPLLAALWPYEHVDAGAALRRKSDVAWSEPVLPPPTPL